MNWAYRLDNFWKGMLIGLLFPMLMLVFYWMFFQVQLSFPNGLLRYLIRGNMLSDVVKLCCIGNLLLFYFGINKKIDKFTKGVITSLVIYVGLVAYITYFIESAGF